jgi:hypothetical protein
MVFPERLGSRLLGNDGYGVSRLANWALITYKDLMETILDHNPTPFELHQLGYTDDATTPLTDKLRAEILASGYFGLLAISDLMAVRADAEQAGIYREKFLHVDCISRSSEELRLERAAASLR